ELLLTRRDAVHESVHQIHGHVVHDVPPELLEDLRGGALAGAGHPADEQQILLRPGTRLVSLHRFPLPPHVPPHARPAALTSLARREIPHRRPHRNSPGREWRLSPPRCPGRSPAPVSVPPRWRPAVRRSSGTSRPEPPAASA